MKKNRKNKPRPERPLPLKWEFGPDVPKDDFFGGRDLKTNSNEVLDDFIFIMEKDEFLAWEAVMAHEQGLRLTRQQRAALSKLLNFGDPEDDKILYIDEIPRPSEPWYDILNKIVPQMVIEPFRTFDVYYEEQCEGWGRLVQCLKEHAGGLSLPPGVSSPVEVVPAQLRHKLWLQECYDALSGLGQEEELTLEDPEQHYRIEDFVDSLREHKASVRYFDLTFDSLLARVIVPEKDRPILIQAMQEKLGMKSTAERITDRL